MVWEFLGFLVICGIAVGIGYFFNIGFVFGITFLVCMLFVFEGQRVNTLPGTSGKSGGMVIGFIVLTPFLCIMLLTSVMVNQDVVAGFFHTLGRILLR